MKRTGSTKITTRLMVRQLQKASRERKQGVWKRIAELVEKPSRQRVSVNLEKLTRFQKQFENKVLVVPGKVLGHGIVNEKMRIAALEWSASVPKKISTVKGELWSLQELLDRNEKPAQMIIVM